MVDTKRLYRLSYLTFSLINLLAFLFFFLPNYVFEVDIGGWEYVRLFFNKIVEFSLAPIGAVIIFSADGVGIKSKLPAAIKLSITRGIFLLPYYYLYHTAYGYDWIESLMLSAAVSLFGIALFLGQIILSCFIADKVLGKLSEKRGQIAYKNPFDLTPPITSAIFSIVFLAFLSNLIYEIISLFLYLIEYSGTYMTDEIIYIVACFLLIPIELIGVHYACCIFFNNFKGGKTNAD